MALTCIPLQGRSLEEISLWLLAANSCSSDILLKSSEIDSINFTWPLFANCTMVFVEVTTLPMKIGAHQPVDVIQRNFCNGVLHACPFCFIQCAQKDDGNVQQSSSEKHEPYSKRIIVFLCNKRTSPSTVECPSSSLSRGVIVHWPNAPFVWTAES